MPYIKRNKRERFLEALDLLPTPADPGELNFVLTVICRDYLDSSGRYQAFNDVVGALENCKLELYRRHLAAFEDEAIKRNGDV